MISNKKELKAEKKRLRQREKELKQKLASDWKELKSTLRPKNIIASQLHHDSISQNGEDSIIVSTITYAATMLGRKLGAMAEEKISEMFKKEE